MTSNKNTNKTGNNEISRTKKAFYNSATSAIQQIVVTLVGFITPRVMLYYYGSDINGLVSSISQFIAYFNIVEAGLAGAATYALYKPLADNDYTKINGIVSAAKKFYTQSGYIFISLTLGLSIIYPRFVKTDLLSPFAIGIIVLVLGISGALEFFTLAKYRVLLAADQKTYVISIATIAQILLNTFIIIVFSRMRVNIVVLRILALFSVFLRSIILMLYVRKNYKFINYNEKPDDKALNKRWDALYSQILGSTQRGAPIILATIFTTLQDVSVYTIYNMIMSGINGILGIVTNGLSASFGELIARGEKEALQKSYMEFEFTYYSLITIVFGITAVTILPFIRIYTKGIADINYEYHLLGYVFVFNGWLYSLKNPQGMLVISAGMYKETRVQSTIQASIIVIAGIFLAMKHGLLGIMIASCLSNLYRDIDLLIFIPRFVTKLSVKVTAFRILRMIIAIFIIWTPYQYYDIYVNNFMQWILLAIGVGIYATFVVLFNGIIFDRKELKGMVARLKSIL